MRVKSIVIDGFKSYAHRKELADLSPHFNAITGLNGSGKSNVFDAICFVMGITNLKKVRAEDPRELIFRAGTTGVHAARVTIEFINDDPATAPPGYSCEDYPTITIGRQIKLGGKQQFFFNSTVSMQSKVKRFFESISLNVDNPHFMVLQGTVHKLIGMRPQEILSLVEEAVGTKAFDHRRRTAEALIRNKEKKMQDIDANIEQQIQPMLEAMKADQEEYTRFLSLREGIEAKQQFRIAFEYHQRTATLRERETVLSQRQQRVASAKEELRQLPQMEDESTKQLMRLQESLTEPSEAVNALQSEEEEVKKLLGRHQNGLDAAQQSVKQISDRLLALKKEEQAQAKSQEAFRRRREAHNVLVESIQEHKTKVGGLKQALSLVKSGVRAGASGLSLDAERTQLELQLIQHAASIKRSRELIEELSTKLQEVQRHRAQDVGQLQQLKQSLQQATDALDVAKQRYAPLAVKEEKLAQLEQAMADGKVAYLRAFEAFHQQQGANNFEVEFDRRSCAPRTSERILGRVGELLTPLEEKYSMALMVGAQTQVMRVVVESDEVADEIIRHGLRQRTAFIALNKLQAGRRMHPNTVAAATRLAEESGGFAVLAKDLVEVHDERLRGLADNVFGNFFVCSSLALAQELAYNGTVKAKAVSLEGEVAEPNGLITGGSNHQLRNIFTELRAFKQRKAPLVEMQRKNAELEAEYQQLRAELHRQQSVIDAFRTAEERQEVVQQQVEVLSAKGRQAVQEIEEPLRLERASLEEVEREMERLTARKAEVEAEAAVDPKKVRHDLEAQLSAAEKSLAQLQLDEEKGLAEYERLEADTEQQASDLAAKTTEAEEELAEQQAEVQRATAAVAEAQHKVKDAQHQHRQLLQRLQQIEHEIEEAQEELTRYAEKRMALDNLVKNSEVELKDQLRQVEELRRREKEDESKHAWLLQERECLGKVDGPYYFDDVERTATTLRELHEVEAQTAIMSRRMNKKATILYEDRRREYEELVQQRATLGEDKEAIQTCITGIEAKKWAALDRMVGVVSTIFGKLFATCLPGATAELLEERDEAGHLSGLGVRVLFNGKPKESLTELSGGQRSLLALCLILAMLRVRPAPIYILDEVDAALDPSHTQNIGQMLRQYFPNSQFLLVSLKDGMFNNANVLFHVRNTQGYSEIYRIEHKNNESGAADGGPPPRQARRSQNCRADLPVAAS